MNSSLDSAPFYCAVLLPKRIRVHVYGFSVDNGTNKALILASSNYWSSTSNANNANNAWNVNFNNGNQNNNNKNNNNYVRCVRAGE
ncbi:DUF1566 domain-containing protein [Sulfurovum sp.]|uniref:Lcl domain-containing protein n=1 Tax=Sulfurovum sp. TaxID=1969726 RepID=UPI0025E1EA19|nr:DUF1566 domain-containing protein [Sulfurovum sp.]